MSALRAAFSLAVLATAATAAFQPLTAQEPTRDRPAPARVAGAVVDAVSGEPIAGALVWLVGRDRQTMTDDAGRFVMEDVPTGPVELQVEQLGYEDGTISAALEGGDDAPLRVALSPRPVVLEGLSVMVDRLAARRLSVGVSVRTLDAEELSRSGGDMYEALRYGAGLQLTGCSMARRPGVVRVGLIGGAAGRAPGSFDDGCVYSRGESIVPSLYIDDQPAIGGLRQLAVYHPSEVYAVEVYRGGSHVRVYTRYYMQRIAEHPRALIPLWW